MRTRYDASMDALSVRLTEAAVQESEEVRPGFILDFDADGRIVGFEILEARDTLSKGTDLRKAFETAA